MKNYYLTAAHDSHHERVKSYELGSNGRKRLIVNTYFQVLGGRKAAACFQSVTSCHKQFGDHTVVIPSCNNGRKHRIVSTYSQALSDRKAAVAFAVSHRSPSPGLQA